MNQPSIVVNVAQSLDGYISGHGGKRVQISCEEDMRRVTELRNQCDAVMVGKNTALLDNPHLKAGKSDGERYRIAIDRELGIPYSHNIYDGSYPTIILTSRDDGKKIKNLTYLNPGEFNMPAIMDSLYSFGIRKILVEGGAMTIMSILRSCRIDDFFVYVGPVIIGNGGIRLFSFHKARQIRFIRIKLIGNGVLFQIDTSSLGGKIND
ncbi:MAG: RibD family protein [Thermoplasmataceae archaeon]